EADRIAGAALIGDEAHGGELRDFVAHDDEAEVGVFVVAGELATEDGEGFNQARDIFLRANVAGVEDVGIVDLVALQDELAVGAAGGGGIVGEAGVGGVVDLAEVGLGDAEQGFGG